MSTKHTPGPWTVIGYFDEKRFSIIEDIEEEAETIAETLDGSKQSRANAQLIATAPDMLEALVILNELLLQGGVTNPVWIEFMQRANTIIAKATRTP